VTASPDTPTWDVQQRHVDLRPFALTTPDGTRVLPGGLSRVAMNEGSIVVSSSQDGGAEDTSVLHEP
jgi:uncharacterized circularly permuted ATP-grasp superfamily protein